MLILALSYWMLSKVFMSRKVSAHKFKCSFSLFPKSGHLQKLDIPQIWVVCVRVFTRARVCVCVRARWSTEEKDIKEGDRITYKLLENWS